MFGSDAEVRRARQVTRSNARTFFLACRLLPRRVRADVYRLYMVFRALDDLVDEAQPGALERIQALQAWCDGDAPSSPETEVLAQISRRVALPRPAFRAFADGMLADLAGQWIETDDALELYCYQVAGTVGLVMAAVLEADQQGQEAAVALGKAMQLTNILRDIDEDLAAGRCYLPVSPVDLAPGRRSAVVRRYIASADALYEQGLTGLRYLSVGRTGIWSAAVMYREILRQVERDGLGREPGRARVTAGRKVITLLRSLPSAPPRLTS